MLNHWDTGDQSLGPSFLVYGNCTSLLRYQATYLPIVRSAYILPVIGSWKRGLYSFSRLCLSFIPGCNHSHAKLCPTGAAHPCDVPQRLSPSLVESVSLSLMEPCSCHCCARGLFSYPRWEVQGTWKSWTWICYQPTF